MAGVEEQSATPDHTLHLPAAAPADAGPGPLFPPVLSVVRVPGGRIATNISFAFREKLSIRKKRLQIGRGSP